MEDSTAVNGLSSRILKTPQSGWSNDAIFVGSWLHRQRGAATVGRKYRVPQETFSSL